MGGRKDIPLFPPTPYSGVLWRVLPKLASVSPTLPILAGQSINDMSAVQDEVTGLCMPVDERQTVEVNSAKPAFIRSTYY